VASDRQQRNEPGPGTVRARPGPMGTVELVSRSRARPIKPTSMPGLSRPMPTTGPSIDSSSKA
jgi:hypothetical protein